MRKCRGCGLVHEWSDEHEANCLASKLDEQVRLREMAESFLRTAIEINEKNTSKLDEAIAANNEFHRRLLGMTTERDHYRDEAKASSSRLDAIRSGLNDALVHNQGGAITDADSMSTIHELFYQWFQRKDVERQEIK
jgi:hypothetical protein